MGEVAKGVVRVGGVAGRIEKRGGERDTKIGDYAASNGTNGPPQEKEKHKAQD